MSNPSQSSSPPNPSQENYDLSTPEEVAARRKRKKLFVGAIAIVVLLGLCAWGAHPVFGAIKAWQARRTAAAALQLLSAGKTNEAVAKIQDALSLRGTDPEVEQVTAVFLTRVGHAREATGFWTEVEKHRALTRDEQRDFATDLLAMGDPAQADKRLRLAWPAQTSGTPTDWDLGMRIALKKQDTINAVLLAKRLLDGKAVGATEHERLDAASTLLANGDPADEALGEETLYAVADGGRSIEPLDALLLLTRQAVQKLNVSRSTQASGSEEQTRTLLALADRIENHPRAKVSQKLLALQARIIVEPSQRDQLVQRAIERFGSSKDNDDLLALTTWLYSQGEYQDVLNVLSADKATESRSLYLQFLDALGALGRWQEVRSAIEGQRFTLDPVVEQMYLARCAQELHQPESADLHWNAALRAAGSNPEKLLSFGHYAQANGVLSIADSAYQAVLKTAPDNRAAHESLLSVLEAQGQTHKAREELAAMLGIWGKDSAVRNDFAYLGALLNLDLPADHETALDLVRTEPNSLPHRVLLALTELRMNRALTALDAVKPIDPRAFASQARFEAVHAAVLWETGFNAQALQEATAVDRTKLLPEERQLLDSIREKNG